MKVNHQSSVNIGQTLQKLQQNRTDGMVKVSRDIIEHQKKAKDLNILPITRTLGQKKAMFDIKG